MIFDIEVSENAQDEILDAIDWYEQKQEGLGDRFASVFVRTNKQNP